MKYVPGSRPRTVSRPGEPKRQTRSVVRTHELLDEWLGRTGLGRLHWRQQGDDRLQSVLAQLVNNLETIANHHSGQ